jgi:hypothetical protein
MVCNISPTKSIRKQQFFRLLSLLANIIPYCHSLKRQSVFSQLLFHGVTEVAAIHTFLPVPFSPFFPTRSGTLRPPSNTLHMVRSWRSVELIFVSLFFFSSFCSQLRRARIKAPQSTTTSTLLMSSSTRRRQRFHPSSHRDPTSNRKKNRTGLQPQKGRLRGPIRCGHMDPKSSRPHSRPVHFGLPPCKHMNARNTERASNMV